jgi:hypothetical protein
LESCLQAETMSRPKGRAPFFFSTRHRGGLGHQAQAKKQYSSSGAKRSREAVLDAPPRGGLLEQ